MLLECAGSVSVHDVPVAEAERLVDPDAFFSIAQYMRRFRVRIPRICHPLDDRDALAYLSRSSGKRSCSTPACCGAQPARWRPSTCGG